MHTYDRRDGIQVIDLAAAQPASHPISSVRFDFEFESKSAPFLVLVQSLLLVFYLSLSPFCSDCSSPTEAEGGEDDWELAEDLLVKRNASGNEADEAIAVGVRAAETLSNSLRLRPSGSWSRDLRGLESGAGGSRSESEAESESEVCCFR